MASLDDVVDQVSVYASNLNTQVHSAFSRMTAQDYLRLVIIVGAYALLRPYILKFVGARQQRGHEREIDPAEMQRMRKNVIRDQRDGSLRERVAIPEDTDSESGGGENKPASTEWGKKARRRQRRVVRTLLEQEERRKREAEENESDKDIEDLLID